MKQFLKSFSIITQRSALANCQLLIILLASCQTDGEYAEWATRTTPVRAEFKYLAEAEARFAVEYDGKVVADTLPYSKPGRIANVSDVIYLNENRMNGLLRVYRLGNGERILETEEEIVISPVIVGPGGSNNNPYSAINLVQLAAGSPVQVMHSPETPADSSAIALQFFYGDGRQPEKVRISLLAVDQYSLITKQYKLANVPDTMKVETGEIALRRGELSETVTLDLNLFGEDLNKGLAAKFYYRVSDPDGHLLQDYKPASSAANAAEIKPESVTKNKIPRPVYQSAVMQWGYKSAAEPFASPTVLLNGEKW
jgi:hypothetical protein